MKSLQRVAVTGAAGQVAYSLLFNAAKGDLFGPGQPIALHLLDLPEMQKTLEGIAMELEDCAFPLLREIKIGSDPKEIFDGVHYALLLGARPRQVGMERKDLLSANGKIFREQGRALDGAASPGCARPCRRQSLQHQLPDRALQRAKSSERAFFCLDPP